MMGGVAVDLAARTTLPGLWAAGEVTASGLHGGNRLASNSLLEALVYGVRAGRGAAEAARRAHDDFAALPLRNARIDPSSESLDLADIRNSVKSIMWRNVGVRREREGLEEAAENIDRWSRYVFGRQFADPSGWELQNMLCLARLIVSAALTRQETRGAHVRTDFPESDDAHWLRHVSFPGLGR